MNADRLRRQSELAAFYTAHRGALERILRRRVRASEAVIEDACQAAWTILCAHPDSRRARAHDPGVADHDRDPRGMEAVVAPRPARDASRRVPTARRQCRS